MTRGLPIENPFGMASRLVLVLEDDHHLQESVRRMAERLGYKVVSARTLKEATSLLARIARPCLVLLDTLMKEGIEAMTLLGAQYPLATIPVRLSASNVRRMSKRSVHLDLLREALQQHCGPSDPSAPPDVE
ncbi:MAG TPA: response regulator [Polyangia bacterium]|nr:response regulator [Polyangia bacterium]